MMTEINIAVPSLTERKKKETYQTKFTHSTGIIESAIATLKHQKIKDVNVGFDEKTLSKGIKMFKTDPGDFDALGDTNFVLPEINKTRDLLLTNLSNAVKSNFNEIECYSRIYSYAADLLHQLEEKEKLTTAKMKTAKRNKKKINTVWIAELAELLAKIKKSSIAIIRTMYDCLSICLMDKTSNFKIKGKIGNPDGRKVILKSDVAALIGLQSMKAMQAAYKRDVTQSTPTPLTEARRDVVKTFSVHAAATGYDSLKFEPAHFIQFQDCLIFCPDTIMAVNDDNECLFLLEVVEDLDMVEIASSSLLAHALSVDFFVVCSSRDAIEVFRTQTSATVERLKETILGDVIQMKKSPASLSNDMKNLRKQDKAKIIKVGQIPLCSEHISITNMLDNGYQVASQLDVFDADVTKIFVEEVLEQAVFTLLQPASEVLVFVATDLFSKFSIPVAYFLVSDYTVDKEIKMLKDKVVDELSREDIRVKSIGADTAFAKILLANDNDVAVSNNLYGVRHALMLQYRKSPSYAMKTFVDKYLFCSNNGVRVPIIPSFDDSHLLDVVNKDLLNAFFVEAGDFPDKDLLHVLNYKQSTTNFEGENPEKDWNDEQEETEEGEGDDEFEFLEAEMRVPNIKKVLPLKTLCMNTIVKEKHFIANIVCHLEMREICQRKFSKVVKPVDFAEVEIGEIPVFYQPDVLNEHLG